jgi:hypothetical protein
MLGGYHWTERWVAFAIVNVCSHMEYKPLLLESDQQCPIFEREPSSIDGSDCSIQSTLRRALSE